MYNLFFEIDGELRSAQLVDLMPKGWAVRNEDDENWEFCKGMSKSVFEICQGLEKEVDAEIFAIYDSSGKRIDFEGWRIKDWKV